MNILIFGKNGQVGFELSKTLLPLGNVKAVGRDECDLNNSENIKKLISDFKPDIIVNSAAYTSVDLAEKEVELAKLVNEIAPKVIANESNRLGALLIHFSTDYVFDGEKENSYNEEDPVNPVNIYGATKLAGENAIKSNCEHYIIIRTSWVVGSYGNSFLKKILKSSRQCDDIKVVNDQYGTPTPTKLLAFSTFQIIQHYILQKKYFPFGVYHLSTTGRTSWYEYACHILNYESYTNKSLTINSDDIIEINSSELVTDARRPRNSVLDSSKIKRTFKLDLPDWKTGINQILDEIHERNLP